MKWDTQKPFPTAFYCYEHERWFGPWYAVCVKSCRSLLSLINRI